MIRKLYFLLLSLGSFSGVHAMEELPVALEAISPNSGDSLKDRFEIVNEVKILNLKEDKSFFKLYLPHSSSTGKLLIINKGPIGHTICGIDNEGLLYTSKENCLMIWKPRPFTDLLKKANSLLQNLKHTYLEILPSDIFNLVYLRYLGGYSEQDPNFYCLLKITLDESFRLAAVDPQGTIYAVFYLQIGQSISHGADMQIIIMYQKTLPKDLSSYKVVFKSYSSGIPSHQVAFSDEGNIFAKSTFGVITLWKKAKNRYDDAYRDSVVHQGASEMFAAFPIICLSPTGLLVSGGANGSIGIWKNVIESPGDTPIRFKDLAGLDSYQPIAVLLLHAHSITSLCLGPDDVLFSSAADGIVLWKMTNPIDPKTYAPLILQASAPDDSRPLRCAYNKTNKQLVSTEQGKIKIWEMADPTDNSSFVCKAIYYSETPGEKIFFDKMGNMYREENRRVETLQLDGPYKAFPEPMPLVVEDEKPAKTELTEAQEKPEDKKDRLIAELREEIKEIDKIKNLEDAQKRLKTIHQNMEAEIIILKDTLIKVLDPLKKSRDIVVKEHNNEKLAAADEVIADIEAYYRAVIRERQNYWQVLQIACERRIKALSGESCIVS